MPETPPPKRKRGADDNGVDEHKSPTPNPDITGAEAIAHRRRLELLVRSIPQIVSGLLPAGTDK